MMNVIRILKLCWFHWEINGIDKSLLKSITLQVSQIFLLYSIFYFFLLISDVQIITTFCESA